MNRLIGLKTITLPLLITLALLCFGLSPTAKALLPPPAPDGGYPGGNTAEGINALHDVNTALGINNTAVGANALTHNTTGGYNVAIGARALASNTTGSFNMAVGTEALRDNTANFNLAIGFRVGFKNTTGRHLTVIGAAALQNNSTASFNTAIGAAALHDNNTGEDNTAIGADALAQNTMGNNNTANGFQALFSNVSGTRNTATGSAALSSNTTVGALSGDNNTAVGFEALTSNTTGHDNTAVGRQALLNNQGNFNTALGNGAGDFVFNVICIGADGADVPNSCYIRNIWQEPGGSQAVFVNAAGKLGFQVSSRRFKDEIKAMEQASEILYGLKPVSFRYKPEIEPTRPLGFGLIAEEVEEISPDLVTRDGNGKVSTVRYEAVNAMLLNEFLKEHRKVEKLEATVAGLAATVKEQAAQIQKVSAQLAAASPSSGGLEASKPAPQMVNNP
jgi:trimeric autotransporter adhesin